MAMAANGVFQWGANGASAALSPPVQASFSPPVQPSPRDVARALFADLGLDGFISPAASPREKLMRDIEIFAAGATHDHLAINGAMPVVAPRAALGLFASAPRIAAQAVSVAVPMPQMADHVATAEGAVLGLANGASELSSVAQPAAIAAPAVDKAAVIEEQGWLGLDMSQPREWSANDLAMLMFRDRVAAADSLTLRAEQAAADFEDGLEAFIDPCAFGHDASGEFATDAQDFDEFATGEFALLGQIAA